MASDRMAPAVVNLLVVGGMQPEPAAYVATLLQLAARGHLIIEPGEGGLWCRLLAQIQDDGLVAHERTVLGHVSRRLANTGFDRAPVEAIFGYRSAVPVAEWWGSFGAEVCAEARRLGLAYRDKRGDVLTGAGWAWAQYWRSLRTSESSQSQSGDALDRMAYAVALHRLSPARAVRGTSGGRGFAALVWSSLSARKQEAVIRDRAMQWARADGPYLWSDLWSCVGGRWRLVRLEYLRGRADVTGQIIARRYVPGWIDGDGARYEEFRELGIDDGVRSRCFRVDRTTYESVPDGAWVSVRKNRFTRECGVTVNPAL